ncbi:alpha/beta fold hydrolase [Arthrobacter halodurans]|uniref:Alpha/beta fold hydrolase n=1 Tax=Arthrobacter halodurans TaxID=516699 RepID=A0ABV4UVM6_9MICC
MDIVLVPGFWLDASSWSEVTPALLAAGHRVHPLTLPGKEAPGAPRAGIGLRDHVDAVTAVVDSLGDGPVVLVGHSGGGAIIHGVVDARPDRVARAVYVDSVPLGEGDVINADLPAAGDEVPFPAWDVFEPEDLDGLDDALRDAFRARAVPEPRGVAQDPQRLADERRYDVPATVITCEYPAEMLRGFMDKDHPYPAELKRIRDFEIVDLPTGHWPQFTRPADLGAAILAAVERTRN